MPLPKFEGEEFEFPDEKEAKEKAGEIEIVVEDEKPKYSKLREEPGPTLS